LVAYAVARQTERSFDSQLARQKEKKVQESANPIVKIYVRKGVHDDQRLVSFRVPDGLDSMELLDLGYALDGNQAIFTVSSEDGGPEGGIWYSSPIAGMNRTLTGALSEAQRVLVNYLREKGLTPQFD
jgi:hypothetical protein